MGASTGIEWTDATFNPWWGCERVSDGCTHCYAEAWDKRTGGDHWGKRAERRLFGDAHWRKPEVWNLAAERDGRPRLVFCASMADVFEDRPELAAPRARLFDLIERTPMLRWQLLTKRPQNVLGMVPDHWLRSNGEQLRFGQSVHYPSRWPSNCWLGTTIEHQAAATERLPLLEQIPAPVRFASCEPLLGRVTFLGNALLPIMPSDRRILDWVIVGGESGPGHRPLDTDAARDIVLDCEAAGVPVFFKQVGGTRKAAGVFGGDLLDGRRIKQFPPQAERDVAVAL